MKTPLLGIMALYMNNRKQLEERKFFAKLIAVGHKMGISAYVFTPEDVDGRQRQILAHCYDLNRGTWYRKTMPFPDVVFDRCRYQATPRFQQLRRFRAKYPNLLYMNRPMANKWAVYRDLREHDSIARYLPETELFQSVEQLKEFLDRKTSVYLKPINGTGGRGILRVEKLGPHQYLVQGRDAKRRILSAKKAGPLLLKQMLSDLCKEKKYLIQEGIDTRLSNGRVHDFRALVQKNGSGEWRLTGVAARIGPSGSVTSNLHGGGRAVRMDALLRSRFGKASTVQEIQEDMEQLCLKVAKELNRKYGALCELALDIAVDRRAGVWLLEVNPKPAREVFARIGDKLTYLRAIRRPLEYALWLYRHKRS